MFYLKPLCRTPNKYGKCVKKCCLKISLGMESFNFQPIK